MAITIVPYEAGRQRVWDDFVGRAKNGHFLFRRGYMDYHADRFTDASLLAYEENRLVGLLPANRTGDQVVSHAGLTFGGLLMTDDTRAVEAEAILRAAAEHWRQAGAKTLLYKAIPWIYAASPAEEDLYALHRMGARLVRRDLSTTIDLREPVSPGRARKRWRDNAQKAGVTVGPSDRWAEYHALLEQTLAARHEAKPVHSLEELQLLASRFPQNLRLFEARLEGRLLGGIVIYETSRVAHQQYSANGIEGRDLGAMDLLVDHILQHYRGKVPYYDFGASTTDQGRVLNENLIGFKEAWGGRGVVHDFYELAL